MKNSWKIILLISLIFCIIPPTPHVDAGIKDRLEAAKKKWDQSERKCKTCGKKIHGRNECFTCLSKKTGEKARKTSRRLKQDYQSVKQKSKETYRKFKPSLDKVPGKISRNYERAKVWSELTYSSSKKHYQYAVNTIRDPVVREKAKRAVSFVVETKKKIRQFQKDKTYQTLQGLSSIPLISNGQKTTLGSLSKRILLDKYPGLEKTGLADNGAATITAAICADKRYFFDNARIIESDGQQISVSQAISESTPFDPDKIITGLEIMAAAENLDNAVVNDGDVATSLIDLADKISEANN